MFNFVIIRPLNVQKVLIKVPQHYKALRNLYLFCTGDVVVLIILRFNSDNNLKWPVDTTATNMTSTANNKVIVAPIIHGFPLH